MRVLMRLRALWLLLVVAMLVVALLPLTASAAPATLGIESAISGAPAIKAGPFRCYTPPNQRSEMVAYARYVLDNYDVVAPQDVGSSRLTAEIAKATHFERLDCFVSLVESAIENEVRRNQPAEDADAAVNWFDELVDLYSW